MRAKAQSERGRSELATISATPAFTRASDTLFILGSGVSINELTPAFWNHVHSCDSIGFNNWMVHWFVPNFYMREFPLDMEANEQFARIAREKRDSFAKVPFILRRGYTARRDTVWPAALKLFRTVVDGPLCMVDQINIPAETYGEMRAFCRYWRWLGLHRNPHVHLDIRASVSQLIYFGLVQGYKEIVLCGIDLSVRDYFWEDPRWNGPDYNLPSNNSANSQHRTMDPSLGLPIDRIVAAMRDELLLPAGVQLYVARPSSALANFLPVYDLHSGI